MSGSDTAPAPFAFEPSCAVCGAPSAHVELRSEVDEWRFLYRGPAAGNGSGDLIDASRAALILEAFTGPPHFDLMRQLKLYDKAGYCEPCAVAYCYAHWNPS